MYGIHTVLLPILQGASVLVPVVPQLFDFNTSTVPFSGALVVPVQVYPMRRKNHYYGASTGMSTFVLVAKHFSYVGYVPSYTVPTKTRTVTYVRNIWVHIWWTEVTIGRELIILIRFS
jgi:hypothetical protein